MIPINDKAYKLIHNGSLALSQVEANGMAINVDYIHRAIAHTTGQIEKIQEKMRHSRIYKEWKKAYGAKTNLGSRAQLGKILFDVFKYSSKAVTETGRYKTDDAALAPLGIPFVNLYLKVEKIN